jgi:sugar phosphate isomerase/epimerase
MNVTVNIISGCTKVDQLMHAADLFESFKRYGRCWAVELGVDRDRFKPASLINQLKALLEERGETVTAIWINVWPHINYVDWTVKACSDGQKWMILETYLQAFGVNRPASSGT